MKTQIKIILISSVFALLITSCVKEQKSETPALNSDVAAIQTMRIAYTNAKTNNDSLNYWQGHPMVDSTHCVTMTLYFDSLYHHQDDIMMSNYNICHGNMGSGSGMMNGGMNGSMMGGNNTSMNCTINGNDCTTMINLLHQQHLYHLIN